MPTPTLNPKIDHISTPIARCVTSGQCFRCFHQEYSGKMQNLSKPQTTWLGTLNWSYKGMRKNWVHFKDVEKQRAWTLFKIVIWVCQKIFQIFEYVLKRIIKFKKEKNELMKKRRKTKIRNEKNA